MNYCNKLECLYLVSLSSQVKCLQMNYFITLFMAKIYECLQKASVFVLARPFQPSPMFVSRASAYPRSSTLGQALSLTHKHWTRLERSGKYKHTSLLQTFVNFSHKKCYKIVHLQTLDSAIKAYLVQTLQPITDIRTA